MTPLALAALLVGSIAHAAPEAGVSIDDALARPGLVVIELTRPDGCTGPDDGWADPSVDAALAAAAATAVAIPRNTETVGRLVGEGIRAGELRLAFRDGVEVDRVCGCMDADALKGWVATVAQGGTAASALRAGLQAAPDADPFPLDRWLELVQVDYCAHRLPDAFATSLYLWTTLPEAAPHERAVRFGRVGHDLGVLARKHPPAEDALRALRDGLDAAKDGDHVALADWVALNRILLEDERTLAWFDASRDDPSRAVLVQNQAPNAFHLLAERGRWAEAGAVVGDPKVWLELWKASPGGLEAATAGFAALHAAGRHGDATKLAKGVLRAAPESACGLLAKATEVDAAHPSQKALTKKCADAAVVAAWEAAR